MTLTMSTREFVGLIADVYPFASPDDDDAAWHRVVISWDGERLHAYAGDPVRMAWMSWGPDDGDQPALFAADPVGGPWQLAILPTDAKKLVTTFKVGAKEGEAPLEVDGNHDRIKVIRNSDTGMVALTGVALARPWSDDHPDIPAQIGDVAADATRNLPVAAMSYSGAWLAAFADPKIVRQRGTLDLTFGPKATHVRIGRWFQGAILQGQP